MIAGGGGGGAGRQALERFFGNCLKNKVECRSVIRVCMSLPGGANCLSSYEQRAFLCGEGAIELPKKSGLNVLRKYELSSKERRYIA